MNKTLLASMLALGITVVSTTAMGFELGAARQGRGADDVGGARGVHADGHISGRDRVRGPGDSSGRGRGRGADDIGGARGVHADGHISGRDRVRNYGGLSGGNSGRGYGMGAVGTTNPAGHVRGRGADDPIGHIRQGRGADDVGGARGVHADGHISGRDRVRTGGMGALGLLGR